MASAATRASPIERLQARATSSRSHSPKKRQREGEAEDVDSSGYHPGVRKRRRWALGEKWGFVEVDVANSNMSSEIVTNLVLRSDVHGKTWKSLSLMSTLQ